MKKILIISLLPFFVVGCEKVDQLQRRANTSEQDIKELYREIGELKAKVENCSRPEVDIGSRKAHAPVSTADAELKKIKASISSLEYTQQFCVRESALTEVKLRLSRLESVIREIEKAAKESVTPGCIGFDCIEKYEPNVIEKVKVRIPCKCRGFVPVVGYYGETKECKNCGHDKSQHTRSNVKLD